MFLAAGKLVATLIAEIVHVQPLENSFEALLQLRFLQTVQAAEVFGFHVNVSTPHGYDMDMSLVSTDRFNDS